MTLQTSGAISLANIAAEFGGSTPHSLSEYYGAASGIPNSGTISFNQFYGKSNGYSATMTVGSHTVTDQYVSSQSYGYNNGSRSPVFNGTNFGSMTSINTNAVISGSQLVHLAWINLTNVIRLILEDSQSVSNSGWSTLNWGGNTYSRTSATYTTGTKTYGYGHYAIWSWSASSSPFTSGNRSVSIS